MEKLTWGGAFAVRKHIIMIEYLSPDGYNETEAMELEGRGLEFDPNGMFKVTFDWMGHGGGTYYYPADETLLERHFNGGLTAEDFYNFK